jgi:hypothetical protein
VRRGREIILLTWKFGLSHEFHTLSTTASSLKSKLWRDVSWVESKASRAIFGISVSDKKNWHSAEIVWVCTVQGGQGGLVACDNEARFAVAWKGVLMNHRVVLGEQV